MNNPFRNFFRRRRNRVRHMRFEDFGIFALLRATVLNERVLFFAPDVHAVATGQSVKHGQGNVQNDKATVIGNMDALRDPPRQDVAGYDPVTNPDPDWHVGKMWLDPYHVNPFTENPFDRV